MLLSGTLTLDRLSFEVFQISPGGELLDEVLVTRFPASKGPSFVRVAVFDPAENYAFPQARLRAHRAVSVARQWMRSEPDALVALHGAAQELYDPLIPYDANPLTTVAWADVQEDAGRVLLVSAGRCSDSEIIAVQGDQTQRLLTGPMLTDQAQRRWDETMEKTRRAVPAHRWGPRRWHDRGQVLSPSDFLNPHLGLTPSPLPELFEGDAAPLPLSSLVVATDGLELDRSQGEMRLRDAIAALTGRTPPPGMPYPHGDIAAVRVTALSL